MDALFRLIPDNYAAAVGRLNISKLCEVRICNCAPVRVCYDGEYFFLFDSGITRDRNAAYIAERGAAEKIVLRACSHSLFTITDTLKRGYIAVAGGIRVGVCGAGVMTDGKLTAVKDFSSVNIRLPHEVKGCASVLASKLAAGGLKSALILSPPGAGKTTMLRDLCRTLSDGGYNVSLCDEKHEIAAMFSGAPTLDVGCRTDIICGMDKRNAIETAIAGMTPQIIMTDEIFSADLPIIRRAVTCGVAVIGTMHAKDIDDLRAKPDFGEILAQKIFDSYVVLSGAPNRTVTVYEGVSA